MRANLSRLNWLTSNLFSFPIRNFSVHGSKKQRALPDRVHNFLFQPASVSQFIRGLLWKNCELQLLWAKFKTQSLGRCRDRLLAAYRTKAERASPLFMLWNVHTHTSGMKKLFRIMLVMTKTVFYILCRVQNETRATGAAFYYCVELSPGINSTSGRCTSN